MKSLTLIRGAALGGALLLTDAATAFAAGGSGSAYNSGENTPLNLGGTSAAHASGGGGSSSLVRTIVGLFIVIVVIWGIAWILRRVKGGGQRPAGRGLAQVATLPLGGGRSVALVRAGQELVLVGIAEHAVTPIRTYTEAEAIEAGFDLRNDPGAELDAPETPLDRVVDALRRMTVRS